MPSSFRRWAAAAALLAAAGCRAPAPPSPAPRAPYVPYVRYDIIGRSAQGRAIEQICIGRGAQSVLIMGAFHGDEPQSAYVAQRLADELVATGGVPRYRRVVVIPTVNPDGLSACTRVNGRGVDLNRNFPARNWRPGPAHGGRPASEPETRAVIQAIERFRPVLIVSIHTIRRGRQCVNYDGPAEWLARAMSRACGYPVSDDIGYPTPGSLGSYAGRDRGYPTVTLELPRAASARACWSACREALWTAIRFVGAPGPERPPRAALRSMSSNARPGG